MQQTQDTQPTAAQTCIKPRHRSNMNVKCY